MRPFNLEEYLKDPSRKVVTRNGRDVRILCTDRLTKHYLICALVNNGEEEYYKSYTIDGKYFVDEVTNSDLFFAPEKKEGWINIYKDNVFEHISGRVIHSSEEEAKNEIGNKEDYVTTVKIEWEE